MKRDSKPVAFRLKTHVVAAIDVLVRRWTVSQTAAVERAILDAAYPTTELLPAAKEALCTAPILHQQPQVLAESVIYCKHCGEPFGGQRFQPPLCPNCKATGHLGNPNACGICVNSGTGAL